MNSFLLPFALIFYCFAQQVCAEYIVSPNYLPTLRVHATYPAMARKSEIEGYCVVQFNVSFEGTVKEPSIVECRPGGWFESAVIKAILYFKYEPTTVEGVKAEVIGMKETFWFFSPKVSTYSHIKPESIYNERFDCSAVEKRCKVQW